MPEKEVSTEQQFHRKSAVELFNLVWTLLDKKDRTKEENDRMVHAAHASRYHWGEVGTALEIERGEWQVSRVYSVLGRPQPALYHAERCLEICKENKIGDFDIAFAYEAMARAHALSGSKADIETYFRLAKEAGDKIESKEDREYFFGELNGIPRK